MSCKIDDNIAILFLGTLVPNTPEFQNPGIALSGLLVQEGIVDGLLKQNINLKILSSQPIPSFPNYNKLFCKRKLINYKKQALIITLPAINILVIRELMRGIYAFFSIIGWSLKNYKKKRCVLQYGVYSPPLPIIFFGCKITNSKYVSLLYDLGMPPRKLKLGKLRTIIYFFVELFAKKLIPKMDGRIAINENVIQDYAKGEHCLLIDGGINNNVASKLFDLKPNISDPEQTIFLCAGALWPINGTQLVIDAMKINKKKDIIVWFAGKGMDLPIIQEAELNDNRIKYLGMLNLDELFSYYSKADVLMNIRVDEDNECKYLFPSKFFEYLVTGKHVLTTKVSHLERDYGQFCTVLKTNSPESLSEAMLEISRMTKDHLIEMGNKARNFMLEYRNWDIQSLKIVEYINRAVFNITSNER